MKNSRKKKLSLIVAAAVALNAVAVQAEPIPCILPEEVALEYLQEEKKRRNNNKGKGSR